VYLRKSCWPVNLRPGRWPSPWRVAEWPRIAATGWGAPPRRVGPSLCGTGVGEARSRADEGRQWLQWQRRLYPKRKLTRGGGRSKTSSTCQRRLPRAAWLRVGRLLHVVMTIVSFRTRWRATPRAFEKISLTFRLPRSGSFPVRTYRRDGNNDAVVGQDDCRNAYNKPIRA